LKQTLLPADKHSPGGIHAENWGDRRLVFRNPRQHRPGRNRPIEDDANGRVFRVETVLGKTGGKVGMMMLDGIIFTGG